MLLVSVIAILAFCSATQGWFIVRNRWYETAFLLIVTLALFRPDALMNRVYPEFAPAVLYEFARGTLQTDLNQKVRLHVTRETDYGDRYKLFAFDNLDSIDNHISSLGLTLTTSGDRWLVSDLSLIHI